MQVAVGTYVGDGTNDRAITGVGFTPDLVLIKVAGLTQYAVWRTAEMPAGRCGYLAYAVTGLVTGRIESLNEDGFTISSAWPTNRSGYTYHWLAIADNGNGDFAIGQFAGDGSDDRSIAGVGFQPDMVWCQCEDQVAAWATSDMASGYAQFFGIANNQVDVVQALEADGFQVGTSNYSNQNGKAIYWAAFKKLAGMAAGGQYSGNSTDDRSITGLGFQPDIVIVDSTGSNPALWHPSTKGGDTTFCVSSAAELANGIQALEADGFQVGTHNYVNASGQTYTWWAWKAGTVGSISKSVTDSLALTDTITDREFGAVDSLIVSEQAGVALPKANADGIALSEAISVALALESADGITLDEAVTIDQGKLISRLELQASISPRLSSRVEIVAHVFHDRLVSRLELQATVMPRMVSRVMLEATVVNQALEAALLAEVIAPVAEVTFL